MSDSTAPSNLLQCYIHHFPVPLTIPYWLWQRRDVSLHAKIIWAELWNFKFVFIGPDSDFDKYFLEFLQITPLFLSKIYKELESLGLLNVIPDKKYRKMKKANVIGGYFHE